MNKTWILQEFFPSSSLLSFPKTVSLESCFLIRHPDLGNKVRNPSQRCIISLSVIRPPVPRVFGRFAGYFQLIESWQKGLVWYQFWDISRLLYHPEVASSFFWVVPVPRIHLPQQLQMPAWCPSSFHIHVLALLCSWMRDGLFVHGWAEFIEELHFRSGFWQ